MRMIAFRRPSDARRSCDVLGGDDDVFVHVKDNPGLGDPFLQVFHGLRLLLSKLAALWHSVLIGMLHRG